MNEHKPTIARDVFSYLLMIVMLYIGAVSFVATVWQYVNVALPDPLTYFYTGTSDILRNSISALLIVWPVFVFISWMIGKDIRAHAEKMELRVRKWLLYLTMFVAALAVIIDLISVVRIFLSGELTTRFVFKLMIIFVVAIAVFWYYLWDLKRDMIKTKKNSKLIAVITCIVVGGTIISGFFIIGSPSKQREMRFDEQRVFDLQAIQGQLINYWTQKSKIPATLVELNDSVSGFFVPVDPGTKQSYEYSVKDAHTFILCAAFTNASDSNKTVLNQTAPAPYGSGFEQWSHKAGRVCFDRTIDPELYRPVKK